MNTVHPGAPPPGPAARPGAENGRKHATSGGRPPTEALGELASYVTELKDQAVLLVAAKVDGLKASLRRVVVFAAAGVLGLVLLAVTVAAGAVYLFRGMAQGLSQLFGDRPWLGNLATGLVLLGSLALVFVLALKMWNRASARATLRKYEQRSARTGRVPRAESTEAH
jgi:preprotein translocase subunit SecG